MEYPGHKLSKKTGFSWSEDTEIISWNGNTLLNSKL